jgi:O-antigen/teichoic acid export membrane protein
LTELINQLSSQNIINDNIEVSVLLIRLLISAVLSCGISYVYGAMNSDKEDKLIMMQTLIFLAITISSAMMIIGNNLARAFGLVGAVSIIRFRTAVKSSRDMAFVFVAIVVGMACGLGFSVLAVATALFLGFLMLLLWKTNFGLNKGQRRKYLIKITYTAPQNLRKEIEKELSNYSCDWSFSAMRTGPDRRFFVYNITAKNHGTLDKLSNMLTELGGKHDIIVSIRSRP